MNNIQFAEVIAMQIARIISHENAERGDKYRAAVLNGDATQPPTTCAVDLDKLMDITREFVSVLGDGLRLSFSPTVVLDFSPALTLHEPKGAKKGGDNESVETGEAVESTDDGSQKKKATKRKG